MASHKILVIDDSRVIRMRVKEMLPPGNFEVLEAKDGIEGLNQIRQEHPNLIMLDFLLPKMSGWDVFQHIQSDGTLQSIPLVLMSGRKEEVTEKIPEPFEYFAFVEKPFEKKQLVDAIKEAMAKAKKRPVMAPPPKEEAPAGEDPGVSSDEVQALNAKIEHLQSEVDGLKKQMGQLVSFIKQKLK
ncbi:response regulator [Coleofasciculus sp. F4-SAH-05]|uniref:response regulator n=1 Tax=Coleofasciculus TaxID=669368 RepID=UPI0032FF26B7